MPEPGSRRILLLAALAAVFAAVPGGGQMTWKKLFPTNNPPPLKSCAMAYDPVRHRVVLFGGERTGSPVPVNDTWEWDGQNWIPITPAASPPKMESSTGRMVYDTARGSMFMVNACDREIWTYAPRELTASTHLVSVTTGRTVKLSIAAGDTHARKSYLVLGCMDSGGPRGIPSLEVNLRLNPDPYFWFTTQVSNPLIANSLGALDASGKATATIQVPPLPGALIGGRFYHAYVVFKSSIDYASTPVPLTLVW